MYKQYPENTPIGKIWNYVQKMDSPLHKHFLENLPQTAFESFVTVETLMPHHYRQIVNDRNRFFHRKPFEKSILPPQYKIDKKSPKNPSEDEMGFDKIDISEIVKKSVVSEQSQMESYFQKSMASSSATHSSPNILPNDSAQKPEGNFESSSENEKKVGRPKINHQKTEMNTPMMSKRACSPHVQKTQQIYIDPKQGQNSQLFAKKNKEPTSEKDKINQINNKLSPIIERQSDQSQTESESQSEKSVDKALIEDSQQENPKTDSSCDKQLDLAIALINKTQKKQGVDKESDNSCDKISQVKGNQESSKNDEMNSSKFLKKDKEKFLTVQTFPGDKNTIQQVRSETKSTDTCVRHSNPKKSRDQSNQEETSKSENSWDNPSEDNGVSVKQEKSKVEQVPEVKKTTLESMGCDSNNRPKQERQLLEETDQSSNNKIERLVLMIESERKQMQRERDLMAQVRLELTEERMNLAQERRQLAEQRKLIAEERKKFKSERALHLQASTAKNQHKNAGIQESTFQLSTKSRLDQSISKSETSNTVCFMADENQKASFSVRLRNLKGLPAISSQASIKNLESLFQNLLSMCQEQTKNEQKVVIEFESQKTLPEMLEKDKKPNQNDVEKYSNGKLKKIQQSRAHRVEDMGDDSNSQEKDSEDFQRGEESFDTVRQNETQYHEVNQSDNFSRNEDNQKSAVSAQKQAVEFGALNESCNFDQKSLESHGEQQEDLNNLSQLSKG